MINTTCNRKPAPTIELLFHGAGRSKADRPLSASTQSNNAAQVMSQIDLADGRLSGGSKRSGHLEWCTVGDPAHHLGRLAIAIADPGAALRDLRVSDGKKFAG